MNHYKEEAFNKKAHHYEQRWKAYLNHTHNIFLNEIDINQEEKLLDASSGTGLLAEELLECDLSFKKLVLNDPSTAMLDFARKRLGDHPEISFTNQTAEKLDFSDNYFDCIFCLNAFHFYGAQKQVLNNFQRLIQTGGRLYLLDWNRTGFFRIVNSFIKWSVPENIQTRSLVEMRSLLPESGFHIANRREWSWRYWKFFFIEARKQS
ncbi:MAG: class I SAM-dependent methyltransferase [Balneolaceae bacterium]|nr:class I SAM-dependent methyltransferase [Balneolaceae bacterium]